MTGPRILVFDSGVGGLSVTSCIHQAIPSAIFGYVADNACFPYGDQLESVVVARCTGLITAAIKVFPAHLVVVACNTASTVVLPALRAVLSVPVVGVVPAIKPAAEVSLNRRIGILATPATIRRPYLDHLIAEFAGDCSIARIGHPELVRWIEDWVSGKPLPVSELQQVLQPFVHAEVDTVVLGCTHYPLIRATLEALLPAVTHWVDSGSAIARRTLYLLQQAGIDCSAGQHDTRSSSGCPLAVALFTGGAPRAIAGYLDNLELSAAQVLQHWTPTVNPET